MTMRGAARRTRSAIAETASCRASRRLAAAGISAISCAMAVEAIRLTSFVLTFMSNFADGRPQIAVVAAQGLGGIRRRKPEAKKDGDLHVAVRLFDEARRIGGRTANDLADNRCGAPLELRIAGPHVHHQPPI